MGKENQKKVLAALLAAAIAVPTPVLAASPSDFTDFPDNWAKPSLSHSVSSGLLIGADGMIRPNDGLKRAEMAAIINRLAGAEETASLAGYQDVSISAWYYQDMAKAVRMGTFVGDGSMLRPEAPITRQEAFAVLARYYCLQNTNTDVLQKYADMQQISAWAKNAMAAMVEAGYIHGDHGKLNPLAPITRAEFSQVLYNLAGTIVDGGKTISTDVPGNLVVRGTDVALKNMTVQGDVILADGASGAKLEGVTVHGRIVVRGGTKGIDIKESKADKGLLISNPNKPTVVSAKNSNLREVSLWSDAHLSGDFSDIVIHKPIRLDMKEGKAERLLVNDAAKEAEIKVGKDASVSEIRIEAADVKVVGDGFVSKVQANGDNTQVSTKHTKVTAGSSVQGVKAGGKDVYSNTSVTTGEEESPKNVKKSTSGGSSGNPSGASHKQKVHKASNWKELRQAVLNANAGDTIQLQANIMDAGSETGILLDGVSSATLPLARKNLILDGNGHTISAAEGKTFCFDVDGKGGEATGLEIRNLTVDGASFSKKLGGAFFVEDGATVTFDKVTVRNAKAGHGSEFTGGGAIFINDHGNPPEVTVKGCTFENNTVPAKDGASFVGRGGAIYVNNFRSANAVKLTVTDSTFRGNKAAYGGAVAADGVVELKVENCTFAENSGTIGADDIYIFDGISAGKKGMNISSAVTAVLKGNAYSNVSESADDMTAMNVIFGRYYPADFKGNPGMAPEGAKDLAFSDMKRTQLQNVVEAIPMTAAEIQGKTYYYGVPVYVNGMFVTKFTVNGAPVEAQKIGDTNVYYYAAEQPTGMYYGIANVPFADFYYGELQDVSVPDQNRLVTKVDAVVGLRSRGQYDAVTSATTKKWNQYATTYGKAKEDGSGSVLGLKTPIAVDASIYVQGLLAEKAGASAPNRIFTILSSMTEEGRQITTEPTQQYKILYADGRLSAMHNDGVPQLTATEATAEMKDQTPWGHYLIQVNGLPAEVNVKENLMGVILTDDRGNRYGLKQVDNLFLKNASELAFSVKEYMEPHGNKMQYQRFVDLPGRTITSITYLVKGYQNFTIDHLHLYCGKQLAAEQVPVVTEKTAFENQKGATVKLDVSKLPYTGVELVSVKMGSGKKAVTLEKGTDYTFENHTLQILDTEKTEKGMYTVTFADTNKERGYVSSSISVNLDEAAGKMTSLSDGEWYGIGTNSLYYATKGPDVVRVKMKNGKITGAYPVKHIEDEGFERGQNILDHVKNMSSVAEINALEEQLANKKGAAYDAVSGATETAKGHLSAVKNAIQRSQKYAGDGVEQNIQWFDFATRPKEQMYYGEKLDLTGAILNVYTKDGQKKTVPFAELADYGITASVTNGTEITEKTPGLTYGKMQIMFRQESGLLAMPTYVVAQKKTLKNLPSHLMVHFADGKTQRVELNAKDFQYKVAAEGEIKAIKMYAGDRELKEAEYNAEYNDWEFDLSGVSAGEGYSGWAFHKYTIEIDNSKDVSAVKSFTLDSNYLETTYGVGYALDLSQLAITLKTEKGSTQRLNRWNACEARGFTAIPANGYTFTKEDAKAGTKTIQIQNGDVTQSFGVTVIDYEKQIPAKIVLSDQKGSEVKNIPVDLSQWKTASGMLSLSNIKMPEEYQNWNTETLRVQIYNSSNEQLNDYTVSPYLSGKAMEIAFPHYTEYDSYGGYVRLMFDFSGESAQPEAFADGEWYGTGTWSRNYTLKGPDVVKVTVTDGTIAAVESVKYTDDSHGVYPKGKEIMKHAVGLTELTSLYQQLNEKHGVAYDAVSGATETAKGHLSAIENALARSRQYAKDQQDQQITWMEFKTQPVSTANFGTPLDLSQTVLVLHQLDGGQKEVAFQDFVENGIATNYQNGTPITSGTEGLKDGALLVKFTHAISQTTIPAKIAFLEVVKQKTPSHILVTFADQTTQQIELNATAFRYPLTTEKAISKVEVYDTEKKLADGNFEAQYNEWKISLKDVPVGEGYTEWNFPDYYVKVDTSSDESDVASFTLDTNLIPQQYGVGDIFDLSKINISLKTEKGNPQHLIGWNACLQRGFSVDLEQGHTFTEKDTGEKTITISAGAVKQTFKINVMDYASQVPAKVELYDSKKDKLLQTVLVDAQTWKRDKGCVMLSGIELPDTFKTWHAEDFKVKVYNTEGTLLQEKLYSVVQDFYKEALEIDFPHYKEYYSEGGYLKLYFRFKESEGETPEESHNETAESAATVDGFGYDAKVQVTYNPKTGQIVSVKDHGTEPGGNTHFWKLAAAMFEKFTGKTVDEIDNVDAVSGATLSSNAIKAAVKKALPSATDEEPNVTVEGSAAVGSFGYKAQVSVTYNKKTGEILSVADSNTVPGMNESFWNAAKAMFAKFTGKTAKEIDSIDAVSKATVSSEAIKTAVKQALSSTEDTVDAPKLIAADARTNLLFAATEPALLKVAAPEEAEVFYTTDGSDPTQDGKKKLMNTMLPLSPSENKEEKITVKAAANKNGKWSRVTEIPVEFVKIPPLDNGTKTYVGQAICAGGAGQPYAVKVRVTTVNGRIALLQDNGTEASADTDHAFWWGWDVMGEAGMPAKLKGKSLEELLKAKTTPSEQEEQKVDAVSGATLSSDAVKYAAIAALRSEPVESSIGEVTPPVLTSSRQVAPNSDINSISVVMTGEKGAVIHYTVDGSEPTEESPVASALPPFQEDKGVVLRPETSSHSEGRMIVVKAAAYLDGKRSTTVTERYVFANAKSENSYRLGSFEGTTDGITAKIEVGSPNFDSQYYITKIILDDESRIAYKDFLPELLSQVYLKQGVQGVAQVQDHEAESKRILAAIDAALKEAVLAATPVIQVTPEQSNYPNDAKVTLTLTCATPDAEVYYVVDNSNTLTGSRLSDFETNKMLYEDAVSLTMDQAKGGTLYIRAAAKTGEKNWSPTARKDLSFVKAVQADAFQVGEQGYGTWKEAVAALEKAGGGEILLRDDVELLKTDSLPSVSCTIRSADDQKHRIKGAVMEAKADITFENVIYDINRIYASGHNVTIGADIETPFSFWNRSIFAGPAHDADETDISASPVITVESGKFALYGSGGGKTTVHGNVEIHVNGTASAEVGGAYMSAVVDGSVSVFVENTATLETFLGEQNGGNLTDLTLTVTGSPSLAGRSYRGSVNGTPKGTLDLKAANFSEEEIKKFKDFEKIIKAEMAAAEAEPLLVQPHEMTVLSEDEVTEEPALAEESALPEEPEATTVLPKEEEMMASETTETLPKHTEPMLEDSEIAS